MDQSSIENIQGRIEILKTELIDNLDRNIERMKAEHAAQGLLNSGASIKRVMEEINSLVSSYYSDLFGHIKKHPLTFSSTLEGELKEQINEGLASISPLANERLVAITKFVQKPDLYERMLPEVEDENNKIKKRFENDLNAFVIELKQSSESAMKPWEAELLKIWHYVTKGKRKIFILPIVAISIIIPGAAGISESYSSIWGMLSNTFQQKKAVPSKGESDVFNEWIIAIGHAQSEKSAKELKEEFKKAYLASGHINYKNEPIWINDIFHVRHPTEKGIWIVVIDAYSGESSEKQVKKGLNEMAQLAFSSRELTNTLGHYLYGSRVIYYRKSDFVNTYGNIIGQ